MTLWFRFLWCVWDEMAILLGYIYIIDIIGDSVLLYTPVYSCVYNICSPSSVASTQTCNCALLSNINHAIFNALYVFSPRKQNASIADTNSRCYIAYSLLNWPLNTSDANRRHFEYNSLKWLNKTTLQTQLKVQSHHQRIKIYVQTGVMTRASIISRNQVHVTVIRYHKGLCPCQSQGFSWMIQL